MTNEIIIDDNEMVEFIMRKLGVDAATKYTKEDVLRILDLEFEFLKLKGVIEE